MRRGMAARGPVKDLCEEATCSICLDYFSDPVTIADCGHNFCRACLILSWGKSRAQPACPQCRRKAQPKGLRPNHQLANFVEHIKKLSLQEGMEAKGGEAKWKPCEKHQEPLELFCNDDKVLLCGVCGRSREHRDHDVIPLKEAVQETKTPLEVGKGSICEKHQKPLKLFCRTDEALICMVCDSSTEHKYHDVIPIEEASQEYKGQISSYLNLLKDKKKKMMSYKADIMKDSQQLIKRTKAEKQAATIKFRQLHKFLEEQEQLLLAQMEEVEKKVARKRDEFMADMAKLTEEMTLFETCIQKMEGKCPQLDCEFLQDIKSTLQWCEEKKKLDTPVVLPLALKWAVWDFCDINHFLEGIIKQFQGTMGTGLQQQKAANVTLDPDTAFPWLVISEDGKHVKYGTVCQDLPPNPKRFQLNSFVLGWEGFMAGRHFWEASVKSSGGTLGVGVARKSVRRKNGVNISPEEGIWAVQKDYHNRGTALEYPASQPLGYSGVLKRIRVSLNYAGGRVTFFDADTAVLLYAFSGASFSGEALHPFFLVQTSSQLTLEPSCSSI